MIEIEGADAETAHEIALHRLRQALSPVRDEVDPALAETARSGFEELTIKEASPSRRCPRSSRGG